MGARINQATIACKESTMAQINLTLSHQGKEYSVSLDVPEEKLTYDYLVHITGHNACVKLAAQLFPEMDVQRNYRIDKDVV